MPTDFPAIPPGGAKYKGLTRIALDKTDGGVYNQIILSGAGCL